MTTNLYEYIERITRPIFLKETGSDGMTTNRKVFKIFWRPNNYRRKIVVKKKCYGTIEKIKTTIGPTLKGQLNINPHTKLISIKNYRPNITIQYGKQVLTGIYSQPRINGKKRIFLIEAHSIKDIQERISQKQKEIQIQIDQALMQFIEQFNLKDPEKKLSPIKPRWDRYEDLVKGIDFIDRLDPDLIIHDTYFKKVYGEGIELIQTPEKEAPTIHLKNTIKNFAINDIAPEIASGLKDVAKSLDLINPLKSLKSKVKSIADVFRYKHLVSALSKYQKEDFSNWLFTINNSP